MAFTEIKKRITLFVGIFVPGYFKAQNVARRHLCRENLRQIWTGMSGYAQENDGYAAYARDPEAASRLWAVTEETLGEKFEVA